MSNIEDFKELEALPSIYLHEILFFFFKKNQAGCLYASLIRSLSFMHKSSDG